MFRSLSFDSSIEEFIEKNINICTMSMDIEH
jgi:hypothetical protein